MVSKIPQVTLSPDLKQVTVSSGKSNRVWNLVEMEGGIIFFTVAALLAGGWAGAVLLLVGGGIWISVDYKFQQERQKSAGIISDILSRLPKVH
jgi:hypothetical protein